jgi:hypothetical protein
MLMNEQRREAERGDPRRSLEIAEQASREFAQGDFAVEREAFAILALHRLGERERVSTRASAFLARHPRAPQAAMVRRLFEDR